MRFHWTLVVSVLALVAWVVLRVAVFSQTALIEFPDSDSYLVKAAEPLWTLDFFVGSGRFFVVPLLYKLAFALGGSKDALLAAQLLLSLIAWLVFARSVALEMRTGLLKMAGVVAVLASGLSTEVLQWDVMLLSESVSTSLFVLLVAAWMRMADGLSRTRVAVVILLGGLWSMSREANSLLVVPLGVAIVLWRTWYRPAAPGRERSAVVAGALAAVFVATFAISGSGDRWVFPLLNVIGTRVLISPERTAFYQSNGMPVNEPLMNLAGEFASGKEWAFYRASELENFRAWLQDRGKSTFVKDLAYHPARTLAEPLVDVQEFVCPVLRPYRLERVATVYPIREDWTICEPDNVRAFVAGSAVLGILALALAWLLKASLSASDGFRLLTVAAMLIGWLPFTWFTWHVIGGMEVGRHEWSGILMARVGALLVLVYLLRSVEWRVRPRLPA